MSVTTCNSYCQLQSEDSPGRQVFISRCNWAVNCVPGINCEHFDTETPKATPTSGFWGNSCLRRCRPMNLIERVLFLGRLTLVLLSVQLLLVERWRRGWRMKNATFFFFLLDAFNPKCTWWHMVVSSSGSCFPSWSSGARLTCRLCLSPGHAETSGLYGWLLYTAAICRQRLPGHSVSICSLTVASASLPSRPLESAHLRLFSI